MTLSNKDRDRLRRILGSKFPKSDEAAIAFFDCVEAAVRTYQFEASMVGLVGASQKEFRADCRRVARHAEALLRILKQDSAFPVLIALEMFPTHFRRGRSQKERWQGAIGRVRARKAGLANVRKHLEMLGAAAMRGAEASPAWGENRGRGRPGGLSAAQTRLAVRCCEALQLVNVSPRLTISKRKGVTKGNEAEYPALLRWALEKAGRRTKANRTVTGDVSGIAKAGLDEFKGRL